MRTFIGLFAFLFLISSTFALAKEADAKKRSPASDVGFSCYGISSYGQAIHILGLGAETTRVIDFSPSQADPSTMEKTSDKALKFKLKDGSYVAENDSDTAHSQTVVVLSNKREESVFSGKLSRHVTPNGNMPFVINLNVSCHRN